MESLNRKAADSTTTPLTPACSMAFVSAIAKTGSLISFLPTRRNRKWPGRKNLGERQVPWPGRFGPSRKEVAA